MRASYPLWLLLPALVLGGACSEAGSSGSGGIDGGATVSLAGTYGIYAAFPQTGGLYPEVAARDHDAAGRQPHGLEQNIGEVGAAPPGLEFEDHADVVAATTMAVDDAEYTRAVAWAAAVLTIKMMILHLAVVRVRVSSLAVMFVATPGAS